jgi:hypothetical protein
LFDPRDQGFKVKTGGKLMKKVIIGVSAAILTVTAAAAVVLNKIYKSKKEVM